jgi:hypothetical protein
MASRPAKRRGRSFWRSNPASSRRSSGKETTSWGIAFDFLAQLGIRAGPAVSAQAGLAGWPSEAIAFAYQAGSLLFPALVPVMLWAAFNQPLIARLAQSRLASGPVYGGEQTSAPMQPRIGSSSRSQQ